MISRIETDTETLKRWSQGLRPRLRPPKSQSQSRALRPTNKKVEVRTSKDGKENVGLTNNKEEVRTSRDGKKTMMGLTSKKVAKSIINIINKKKLKASFKDVEKKEASKEKKVAKKTV